jgi:hypothetical protein
VMRHHRPLFARGLGRTDLDIAIDRDRITADNFSIEMSRQRQRERGLAAPCRADQHNQRLEFLAQRALQ